MTRQKMAPCQNLTFVNRVTSGSHVVILLFAQGLGADRNYCSK